MHEVFKKNIDFSKLSILPIEEEKFICEIGQVKLNRQTSIVTFPITLNFIIPMDMLNKIKESILESVPDSNDVNFVFTYKDLIIDTKDIIKQYVPYMIKRLNGPYVAFTKSINLSSFRLSGNILTLKAFGETAKRLLNENVKKQFENIFKEVFDLDLVVNFENDDEKYSLSSKNFAENEASELKKDLEEYTNNLKANAGNSPKVENKESNSKYPYKRREKEVPLEGTHIFGGGVTSPKNMELSEVKDNIKKGIIEGRIFSIADRKIKSGSSILTFSITDDISSVKVKGFVNDDRLKEINGAIDVDDFVRVEGEIQFDTYENINVFMFKKIEKIDDPFVILDTSEIGKRVELHLHTRMSQMDGLIDVEKAITKAASWGQPAIAITDHGVVQSFPDAMNTQGKLKKKGIDIKVIYGVEGYVYDDKNLTVDYKKVNTNHIIILVKSQKGMLNLYKLVSKSHIDFFYKKPRLPWSVINEFREGLIIGSACSYGEIFSSLVKCVYFDKRAKEERIIEAKSEEEIKEIISRYDYLEIQPIINNRFMYEEDREYYFNGKRVKDDSDLREINKYIVSLGDKYKKKVVATTDAHYEKATDSIFRNIIMAGMGYEDAEDGEGLYMRPTNEMLDEFSYLGERAKEVVIDNTNYIASLIEDNITPIKPEKCPPKIEGAEKMLEDKCMEMAHSIYGNPLPEVIEKRLVKELRSVVDNGYSVMYASAKELVDKSNADGYLVGSRGSVGSSFLATMTGITEVNPLDPHYICPNCHKIIWGDKNEYDCGIDMPDMDCPDCGTKMKREGYTIPFETFLGFDGDKEPDIDLNFAGEYQHIAHNYVAELFGAENIFKAGTVSGIQEKTAYGFVKKYEEENGLTFSKDEENRLVNGCAGVKRTTGQHPGGIVIVPRGHEIYEFCPVQRPANDTESDVVTTHFDYHKIEQNLLKLDMLGHDIPSMLHDIKEMTNVDPIGIDISDKKTLSIFNGPEALDIKIPDYKFTHGSYAIPEFGTGFTMQMLDDIHPNRISDLVRIAGFSHGTDVWLNNAQDYIKSGVAKISEVISTRDDIMNYLMLKGLTPSDSFKIMEIVRKKGKVLSDDYIKLMKDHGVPDWYIESCTKIKYMFPRAHAVAYVMMSVRLAWYKVYYPLAFYASYFSCKELVLDDDTCYKGVDNIYRKLDSLVQNEKKLTAKEKADITSYEIIYEMYARGYEFLPPRLGKSDAIKFKIEGDKIRVPFLAIPGMGDNAAKNFFNANEEAPYQSIEDAIKRGKINKTLTEALRNLGVFEGLNETDQVMMMI